MDPVFEQLERARGDIQPHFVTHLKQHIREVVQPRLDAYEALELENERLRAQIAEMQAKRGPGRPRKEATEEVTA